MNCYVFIVCCVVLLLNSAGASEFKSKSAQATGQDVLDRLIFRDDDNEQNNYNGSSDSVQRGGVELATQKTPASAGKTTTEKDGRDNFKGECATGFKRTADGRCRPIF
ncbi:growth-blocking peptide, long form-like [Bombyx mandarina]|uniref:Growth-blocking peptide, long form-like n=1 Tax=Bombyx mandarina TaxID=7092 RepID=A0A6J2K5N1_BOMMA|nr:growth-blocking peptide, long form-like [Bombyx mandarina]